VQNVDNGYRVTYRYGGSGVTVAMSCNPWIERHSRRGGAMIVWLQNSQAWEIVQVQTAF
jgi:hypothetical protein